MAEVASAYVSLVPSAKGFGKGISSQIGGDLDKAGVAGGKRFGGGMSSGLAGMGKSLFGPLAAIGGALIVGDFFKGAYAEARESQKVGALTENVIKTTGGAAKVSAGQVGDLAMAISNKTGIDDEAIQSGSNLLLTFKNVKNEVGKGANVFDRATAAAVDLSASGFGDVSGSSKMLGKALNDPIAGITALGRAGVTFTADQKKQIKGMVEQGDVLGAQKIIMAEVESQVGGAAAASATAGEKLSTTWGNVKETIGTALLPVIDKVMGKFSDFLGFLMTNVGPAFTTVSTFLAPVITAVKDFFTSFQTGGGPGAISGAFAGLVTFFQTSVVPAVTSIVDAVKNFIAVALPIAQEFVAGMKARIEPMMPMIKTIFDTVGEIITGALELIRALIERVTTVISFIWTNWGGSIMSFITGVWSKMLVIIQAALSIIQGVIKTVTSIIKGDWSGAWEGIKQILSGVWSAIKGIISAALNIVGGIMSAAWALIKRGVSAAWDGIKSAIAGKIREVVSEIGTIKDKITGALSGAGTWLLDTGKNIVQGLIDGVKGMAGTLGRAILSLIPGPVRSVVANALGINSPSKVFAELGRNTVQGFIVGVDGKSGALDSTMKSLVKIPRVGSLDLASPADRAAAVDGSMRGDLDYAAIGRAVSEGMKSAASSTQHTSRNRPSW